VQTKYLEEFLVFAQRAEKYKNRNFKMYGKDLRLYRIIENE